MLTKKALTRVLQGLRDFPQPNPGREQYPTPPGIAAAILVDNKQDITGKSLLDLGAGTGVLGIGALLLGAKKVVFIEKDEEVLKVLRQNITEVTNNHDVGAYEVLPADLNLTDEHADTVIMNPPFGTREPHADTHFLDYALTHAATTITLHKTSTQQHIRQHVTRLKKNILNEKELSFPLAHTMEHHRKPQKMIAVTVFTIK